MLPHVLSHVERRGARLAPHVHLQGHVRDRAAAQQDLGDRRRVPRIRHLSRIRTRFCVPLLLPSYARPVWWLGLGSDLLRQNRHQQHLYVVFLLLGQRCHVQLIHNGVLQPTQLSTLPRLLSGSGHTAKLDLSNTISRLECLASPFSVLYFFSLLH